MDNKINIDLPNQIYYLYIPSHAHQSMFSSVFAYDALLETLKEQASIEIIGYCLLPASLHLLVYSTEAPSNWVDSWLMKYNQWHQDTTGESGYLFSDEKKRQVLIQPRYLIKALKYVHDIPIQTKLCSRPDQYLYSSYHDYMSTQSTGVKTTRALAALSPHNGQRIRRFEDYMLTPGNSANKILPNGNSDFYFAYAERAYITKAMSLYASSEIQGTEQQHTELWQSCLESLSEATQLDTLTLLGIRRHHSLPDAHFLLAWLFIEIAKGPTYIAAKQLGLDEMTIELNINSIQLHHPDAYLRYIANSWQSNSKVA
jgi:hypothetical protein